MKVTIYDVAKKAGVSIATVSNVINNTGNMRESTRQRVKEVMHQLNYSPNAMASALMGKGTKTLGLIVPDISNPFWAELAKTIEDRAHEKGFSVFMSSTDEKAEKEKKYIDLMINKNVDGFIICSTYKNKDILINLIEENIPMILLTKDDSELDVTKIAVDDFKGGYEATSHLLQNGHRNIAIISELNHSGDKRLNGYREALKTYDIDINNDYIIRVNASIENGIKSFNKLFDDGHLEKPTAIFAGNEQIAIGVIHAAKKRNFDIPSQLSLVGFDDTILATITDPPLTTIAQPTVEMGIKSVDRLINEIKIGKSKKERILYNPELKIRETTRRISITN